MEPPVDAPIVVFGVIDVIVLGAAIAVVVSGFWVFSFFNLSSLNTTSHAHTHSHLPPSRLTQTPVPSSRFPLPAGGVSTSHSPFRPITRKP